MLLENSIFYSQMKWAVEVLWYTSNNEWSQIRIHLSKEDKTAGMNV